MKVITEKSKTDIGKRLAAIYYIALHGFGEDVGSNFDSATKIIEHIYDIAYTIGGEHLANIEIPAYITRFNEYMKKKKMNNFIRCRDCKHFHENVWGDEIGLNDWPIIVGHEACDAWGREWTQSCADGYCHMAERRTDE